MSFASRFRQGMKAAIPIWIAFVPSSLAWGIAAQAHGLTLGEIILMSAWVYSGPAQFAVLVPLAEGKSAVTVLMAGLLMNLRFLPMSMALAPYFRGVERWRLLIASQVVSASSFVVPYLRFQKERDKERDEDSGRSIGDGYGNLGFFVGVGATAYCVWVGGSTAGYGVGVSIPPGFEEGLRFILPGYFAGLLVTDVKGVTMPLICLASILGAIPGAMFDPNWGWLVAAAVIAVLGWSVERCFSRA